MHPQVHWAEITIALGFDVLMLDADLVLLRPFLQDLEHSPSDVLHSEDVQGGASYPGKFACNSIGLRLTCDIWKLWTWCLHIYRSNPWSIEHQTAPATWALH